MKLQKILKQFEKLYSRKLEDLSLERIKLLMSKLGNPQDQIKCIQICGTNGKGSTAAFLFSILKEANYRCNLFTSPSVLKVNERFIYNNKMISDEDLADLLIEVNEVNGGHPLSYFEALTAAFFLGCKKYTENIVIAEFGLFGRLDAVNILKKNLANIVCSISEDHLSWLPEDDRNIERIIYEKTSSLLNSNIIVAKQNSNEIVNSIKKNLLNNSANKLFYNEDYNFFTKKDNYFYYEDKFGSLKIPKPSMNGKFQIENASSAIATLRVLDNLNVNNLHITKGVKKAYNMARLEEIKSGKLKNLVPDNTLIVDTSHNPGGAEVLNEYIKSLNCDVHAIIGMMADKPHEKFISHLKDIKSISVIDIPNTVNSISGKKLKEKFKMFSHTEYKASIEQAIKSISLKKGDYILISGSIYLAGEVLKLN